MNHEVERKAQSFLTRACSGRWPIWRLLGMRRHGDTLLLCVKWLRGADAPYSVVEMALDKLALSWRYHPTAAAACAALAALDAQHALLPAPTAPIAG
jgi:hypothetical protein